MSHTSPIELAAERTEQLTDILLDVMVRQMENAAEKWKLATDVVAARQKMAAYRTVLDLIGRDKIQLIGELEQADSVVMQTALRQQLSVMNRQERGILEQMGVPEDAVTEVIQKVDRPLYVRDGKRFVPLNGTTAA